MTATALATGSYTNTATKTASSPTDPDAGNDSVSCHGDAGQHGGRADQQ